VECAENRTLAGQLGVLGMKSGGRRMFGHTEIHQLRTRFRQHDVGGLQIAMDETNLVRLGQELYGDPFVNAAMTFIEPFPIGLIITLISAVVLRRKPRAPSSPSASPASS